MTEKQTDIDKLDQPLSIWFILIAQLYIVGAFSLMVFLPAGDWTWLEGWILVLSVALNFGIGTAIINRQNPRVLRNRMRTRKEGLTQSTEKQASSDRFILPMMVIGWIGGAIVAALGHRFGWYTLPFSVALFGALMMNLGVIIGQVATNQNAYASKILDISKGQVLVDTGLYSRVRHPLYTGYSLMILFWPIALGSLWGLPLVLLAIVSIVIRIHFEEEMLLKGMEGYEDYQSRVKYKLIPKIY